MTQQVDHRTVRALLVGAFSIGFPVMLSGACTTSHPPAVAAAPAKSAAVRQAPSPVVEAPSPCDVAEAQRARVPSLAKEGRLDRIIRVLEHADGVCPGDAAKGWAARLTTLVELGRSDEATELARVIEQSTEAPAAARAAAVQALEALATRQEGNAGELYQAGRAAKARGDRAEMQRLFDRAMVAAERAAGEAMRVDHPPSRRYEDNGFAWGPAGDWLAVAEGGAVSLRQKRFGYRETHRIDAASGEEAQIVSLAFSPEGRFLATGSRDRDVRLWKVGSWAQATRFEHPPEQAPGGPGTLYLSSLLFSPDGASLLSSTGDGGWGGSLRLWDPVHGKSLRRLDGGAAGSSLEFAPDGRSIVGRSAVVGMRRWQVSSGRVLEQGPSLRAQELNRALLRSVMARWKPPTNSDDDPSDAVEHYSISPDRKRIAVTERYGDAVHVLDVRSGKPLQRLVMKGRPNVVEYSPDGSMMWARSSGAIAVWRAADGASVATFDATWGTLTFSPDSTMAGAVDAKGEVLLLDVTSGEVARAQRPLLNARGLAPADNGQRLKIGTVTLSAPDGSVFTREAGVVRWSTAAGEQALTLQAFAALDAALAETTRGPLRVELLGPDRDAASGALLCRAGTMSFPFELCRERFEVPGLATKVLDGDRGWAEP